MKLYQRIAQLLRAIANCEASGNAVWLEKHRENLLTLCREHLPSGSGFDAGCKLQDGSTPNRLIFSADFHHMDDHGYYDGWTMHQVIVSPDLAFDFTLRITGKDRRDIKDYIHQTFNHVMLQDVES